MKKEGLLVVDGYAFNVVINEIAHDSSSGYSEFRLLAPLDATNADRLYRWFRGVYYDNMEKEGYKYDFKL